MVGVVGVATDGETLSNGLAGRHGGNLDDHLHGKGARIYFPVRQPGGMFAVGDMHASMGDGEICFTGVEIAGEVDVRFDLLKGKQATWPVTELADRWVPHATADDYDEALQLVSEEAARLLVDEHGFTMEDAFIFLSVACDAGVAQACKPAPGFGTIARFSIPKIAAVPGAVRRVSCTPWPPPTRSSRVNRAGGEHRRQYTAEDAPLSGLRHSARRPRLARRSARGRPCDRGARALSAHPQASRRPRGGRRDAALSARRAEHRPHVHDRRRQLAGRRRAAGPR